MLNLTRRKRPLFVGPSGFYTITIPTGTVRVYVDQDYDGGGWVLVIANRQNTLSVSNTTYSQAVNNCTYMNNGVGIVPTYLSEFNALVGLKHWSALSGRSVQNTISVVQYVAPSVVGLSSIASHTKRHRWQFSNFNESYAMVSPVIGANETGSEIPGMFSYHATNGYPLSSYDVDQDQYPTSCSAMYNNNPWWYGSCWSGSFYGGGGGPYYLDKPYWQSSLDDHHAYGAVYIK